MYRTAAAIVAVAGIVVACAPLSQTPASPNASPTQQQQLPANHGSVAAPSPQKTTISFSGITKAGHSVADVYAGQADLAGSVVSVRGKVVKFNARIMGRNWAHVQDGSGATGTNDLTVTTKDFAKVGDTVLVSGKVALNRDFGGGYRYDLIVEDGSVTVEP